MTSPRRRSLVALFTSAAAAAAFGFLATSGVSVALAAEPAAKPAGVLQVIPARADWAAPGETLHRFLLKQAQARAAVWRSEYEARKTPEEIQKHQARLKEKFRESLGGFPERTPLAAKTVGKIERERYTIEKVLFESQPGHHVTANLYLPNPARFKPPYPGVVVPCGHAADGKAYPSYQSATALLATHGVAGLIFDPICQGERSQAFDPATGKPTALSTTGHTLIGLGSILLGENVARFEVWDAMRALDYLESRPEIDPHKLGAMGNSGGGTQTSYLMALDDRVQAAAPCCYITSFPRLLETIGPQDAEQNVFGQLAWGMDHADYLTLRAPRPTLVCAATRDFFDIGGAWSSFRDAKRVYSRLGFAERVDLFETDAPHSYERPTREASVRWMTRWLANRDEPVEEPENPTAKEAELYAAPEGRVANLPGERTAYDLNRATQSKLAAARAERWSNRPAAENLAEVRRIVGLPKHVDLRTIQSESQGTEERNGATFEKYILWAEEGLPLAVVVARPKDAGEPRSAGGAAGPILATSSEGLSSLFGPKGSGTAALAAGRTVVAVDLRGQGETRPKKAAWYSELFGFDGRESTFAYLLGESLVAQRASDLLRTADWASKHQAVAEGVKLHLVAEGNACVAALHAAALEPALFDSVSLSGGLVSWADLFERDFHRHQAADVVHGALRVYDLPDLARTLGAKLKIEDPRNALGQPLGEKK